MTSTMAENKLEGFEDFENILGDAEASGEAAGGGEFSSELDNLLGEEAAPEQAPAGGGGGDSELDSFFEDLSTIDDLEVLQEEKPEPAGPEPEPAPAAAAARPEPAPRREAKPAPRPKTKKKRGAFGRMVRWLVLLALLGGGLYAVYIFFFPTFEVPWPVSPPMTEKPKAVMVQPPPQPMVAPQPAQPPPRTVEPAPPEKKPPPRPVTGPYSIQVATCFFQSCVDGYQRYLKAHDRSVKLKEKTADSQAVEILSQSAFQDRPAAQDVSDQINRENHLEGHAFVFKDGDAYRVSMGSFPDLSHANTVRDTLNQHFGGSTMFTTRLKAIPYKLRSVRTGGYATRQQAEQELGRLRKLDRRFADAFVVKD
jgi:hypothetical protein